MLIPLKYEQNSNASKPLYAYKKSTGNQKAFSCRHVRRDQKQKKTLELIVNRWTERMVISTFVLTTTAFHCHRRLLGKVKCFTLCIILLLPKQSALLKWCGARYLQSCSLTGNSHFSSSNKCNNDMSYKITSSLTF